MIICLQLMVKGRCALSGTSAKVPRARCSRSVRFPSQSPALARYGCGLPFLVSILLIPKVVQAGAVRQTCPFRKSSHTRTAQARSTLLVQMFRRRTLASGSGFYEAQRGRAFGTGAEYVVVPSSNAVRLPEGVSFVDAACLGVPAMTAHRCLFVDGPIAGKTILVTGAAGGVGQYAVQLAKWGGATVIATVSSAEKAEQARAIGADHVINYREEDVVARAHEITSGAGVDRIVEVAFGANLPISVQILKTNGVIATYSSDADPTPSIPFGQLLGKDLTVRFVLVYVMGEAAHQEAIKDITIALEAGLLHPVAVQRFSLDAIAAAHEAVETGHTAGKVLIDLRGESA
jgi:NADPH:quinone reductase